MIRITTETTPVAAPVTVGDLVIRFRHVGSTAGWMAMAMRRGSALVTECGEGRDPQDALDDVRARLATLRDDIDALLRATADDDTRRPSRRGGSCERG